ncbi:hypothetical protein PTI98_007226 [Pleurotus ostreatus]|nr:hypothetical protein PTI98_007226 [Pleurotus ostreatus]
MTATRFIKFSCPHTTPPFTSILWTSRFSRGTHLPRSWPTGEKLDVRLIQNLLSAPLNGYFDSYALSKNHAEIWEEAGQQIFIRDVESLHGTFINGERISPARAVSEKCELRNNDIVQFGVDFVDENDEYHHKIAARVFCIFKSEDMQVALRSYNENPQDAVPPDDEGLQAPLHPDNADLQGSLPSEDAAVSPGVGPSPASTEDVRPLKSETDFVSSEDIDPFKSEADFVSSEAEKSFFDFSSNDCDGDDNEGGESHATMGLAELGGMGKMKAHNSSVQPHRGECNITPALSELRALLGEIQEGVASQGDRVGKFERLLKGQEGMKQEIAELRAMVGLKGHASETEAEGDDDEDEEDEAGSTMTVVPRRNAKAGEERGKVDLGDLRQVRKRGEESSRQARGSNCSC